MLKSIWGRLPVPTLITVALLVVLLVTSVPATTPTTLAFNPVTPTPAPDVPSSSPAEPVDPQPPDQPDHEPVQPQPTAQPTPPAETEPPVQPDPEPAEPQPQPEPQPEPQPAEESPTPMDNAEIEQMRAFWAASLNEGFRNPAEVDEMINNVLRANANTIIVQMRRHGDSWYNQSIEPRAADPGLAPADQFDPLAYILQQAKPHGIKVHAWLVVSVTCRSYDALRGHPNHICTTHGPDIGGAESWTTVTYGGTPVGDLDFGHPAAIQHMEAVVQNLLWNYPDLDGIHFDFIRYSGKEYGYNQVSVERFNRAHGLPLDNWPAPGDGAWSQWRRDRMTELMRRLYIRIKAIDPRVQVSIAAITWGGIGTYTPDDWPNSAAYSAVFQDWKAWLEEGIVDFALPMQYFEEGVERSRNWYNGWLVFDRNNSGRRRVVVGLGSWLNNPDQNIAQVRRALEPDEQQRYLAGVAFYAYHNLFTGSNFQRRREFMDYLRAAVFSQPARAPEWPWIAYPTHGMLQGVATIDGQIIPDAKVSLIKDGGWVRDLTASADGWYGAVELEPGTYAILVQDPATGREVVYEGVQIQPGVVAHGS